MLAGNLIAAGLPAAPSVVAVGSATRSEERHWHNRLGLPQFLTLPAGAGLGLEPDA